MCVLHTCVGPFVRCYVLIHSRAQVRELVQAPSCGECKAVAKAPFCFCWQCGTKIKKAPPAQEESSDDDSLFDEEGDKLAVARVCIECGVATVLPHKFCQDCGAAVPAIAPSSEPSQDMLELFAQRDAHKPRGIELETVIKLLVPDYIPAILGPKPIEETLEPQATPEELKPKAAEELAAVPPPPPDCTECGMKIVAPFIFCVHCGTKVAKGGVKKRVAPGGTGGNVIRHPKDKGAVPLWRASMKGNDWGKGDKPLPDGLVSPAMLETLKQLGPHFFGPYPPGMEWTARGVKHFSGSHVGGNYAKGRIWIGDKGAYGGQQAHDGNPDGWKCHGRQIIIDKEAGTFFQGYMSHWSPGNIYGRERIQGRTIRRDGSVKYMWLDGSQRDEPEVAPFEYSDPGGGENQLEASKKELATEDLDGTWAVADGDRGPGNWCKLKFDGDRGTGDKWNTKLAVVSRNPRGVEGTYTQNNNSKYAGPFTATLKDVDGGTVLLIDMWSHEVSTYHERATYRKLAGNVSQAYRKLSAAKDLAPVCSACGVKCKPPFKFCQGCGSKVQTPVVHGAIDGRWMTVESAIRGEGFEDWGTHTTIKGAEGEFFDGQGKKMGAYAFSSTDPKSIVGTCVGGADPNWRGKMVGKLLEGGVLFLKSGRYEARFTPVASATSMAVAANVEIVNVKDVDLLAGKNELYEEEENTCPICFEEADDIEQIPHWESKGDISGHKLCGDCR